MDYALFITWRLKISAEVANNNYCIVNQYLTKYEDVRS